MSFAASSARLPSFEIWHTHTHTPSLSHSQSSASLTLSLPVISDSLIEYTRNSNFNSISFARSCDAMTMRQTRRSCPRIVHEGHKQTKKNNWKCRHSQMSVHHRITCDRIHLWPTGTLISTAAISKPMNFFTILIIVIFRWNVERRNIGFVNIIVYRKWIIIIVVHDAHLMALLRRRKTCHRKKKSCRF